MLRQIYRDQAEDTVEFLDIEFLSPIALSGITHKLQLSRQDNFFLAEMEKDGILTPIVSLKMNLQGQSSTDEEEKLLSTMQKLSSLQLTPFPIHSVDLIETEESRFSGSFAVIDHLKYNGYLITAHVNLDLARFQKNFLSDTGRVPFFLESAFQTASKWRQFRLDTHHWFMPKHVDQCIIYSQKCREARDAKVYCQWIKRDKINHVLHLNLVVVNENEEPLIVLRNFTTARTSYKDLLPLYTIPTNSPFEINQSHILVLPIEEAYQYIHQHRGEVIIETENAEICSLPSTKRQKEKLAGKLASKFLVKDLLGDISLNTLEVLSDKFPIRVHFQGKPLEKNPHFSISHSHQLVCVAENLNPIGVDIEEIRPLSEKTIADCCGERLILKIQEYIDARKLSKKDILFLKKALPILVFTQKEAVLKAAGIGIGDGLSEVQIEEINIQSTTMATYRGSRYEINTAMDKNHVLSVAKLVVDENQNLSEFRKIHSKKEEVSFVKEIPISLQQEAFLANKFFSSSKEQKSYTLALYIEMEGTLSQNTLQKTLQAILQKHDILRTIFKNHEGHYSGWILDFDEVEINQIKEIREKDLSSIMDQHSCVPFSSSENFLFKVNLIQLHQEHHILQMIFHHSIMDCFSALILAQEIINTYKDILLKNPLTKVSKSYSDFAKRERKSLTPEKIASLKSYWEKTLEGITPVQLPAAKGKSTSLEKYYMDYDIAPSQKALMEEICQKFGVTLFTGILTALQIAIIKYTEKDQSLVYIPFSMKDNILDNGAIGPFIRLLPIHTNANQDKIYEELLKEQRAAIFDALEHSRIDPFLLKKILLQKSGLQKLPPYIICQLLYETENEEKELPLKISTYVRDSVNPNASIILSFFHSKDNLRCNITFNKDFIDREEVEILMGKVLQEWENLCANPSQTILAKNSQNQVKENVNQESKVVNQSRVYSRDQVVDQIIIIWQNILQNNYNLKKDNNFFELGGQSLQAVKIISNFKNLFGVELPLSSFVEAPTPLLQAELLLSYNWEDKWETVVALKPSGQKPPFFCVHPSGGNIICYMDLAFAMEEDYPFYGLQAKGLRGDEEPLHEVEEMAQHYIHEMKKIQKQGPYHIGGWSAGGVIAFEMAQQLKNRGEEVCLILIDSLFPGRENIKHFPLQTLFQILKRRVCRIFRKIIKKAPSEEKKQELLVGKDPFPIPKEYKQGKTLRNIWRNAFLNYKPEKFPGKLTLLLSKHYEKRIQDYLRYLKHTISARNLKGASKLIQKLEKLELHNPLNWNSVSKKLEIIPIPGDHHSLLRDKNAQQLARYIMKIISS